MRLRLWHLFGLIAAFAVYLAVMNHFRAVHDPAYAWSRQLRSIHVDKRLEALREIKNLGLEARSAFRPLLEALSDVDPRVRKGAAETLQSISSWNYDAELAAEVKSALTLSLHDPDIGVRHAVAFALSPLEPAPKVVVPTLIEILGDSDPKIRSEAIVWLRGFAGSGSVDAFKALLTAIKDRDPSVRLHALQNLSSWQSIPTASVEVMTPVFVAATKDRDPSVQRLALSDLYSLQHLPTAPMAVVTAAYIDALRDDVELVRNSGESALQTLVALRRIDFGQVFQAMSDPNPFVRKIATTYLPYYWHRRDIFAVLMRAITDPDAGVREAACQRIPDVRDVNLEEILPALRHAMEDENSSVREKARMAFLVVERLDEEFQSSALPHCLDMLKKADPGFRLQATMILSAYGPRARAAVPALIVCLEDRDPGVRAESARTLGLIGPAAKPALLALDRLAADKVEDELVRFAAKDATASIRDAAKP